MRTVMISSLLALFFWFFMFSPFTKDLVNFWSAITVAAITLGAIFFISQRRHLKALFVFTLRDVLIGLSSAALLYGIFYCGHYLITEVHTFGRAQVSSIYAIKVAGHPFAISFLLLMIIGPAEVLFWQGLVQYRLQDRCGRMPGFLLSCGIYALVHIWAGNPTLLIAALVCGLFWGYLFFKIGRLWPVIISHAAWDLAIFIIWPIQ